MKKIIRLIILPAVLCLSILTSCMTAAPGAEKPANIYKEDYLEACKLISENYIYLEDKLNVEAAGFFEMMSSHAEKVEWSGGDVFVRELRALKSRLPDGHLSWILCGELKEARISMYLGFNAVSDENKNIIVDKVYGDIDLEAGDSIISYNGKPITGKLEELSRLYPQSTEQADLDMALKYLSFSPRFRPLRDSLGTVSLEIRKPDGGLKTVDLEWSEPILTDDWEKLAGTGRSDVVLLNLYGLPSIEEIPEDAESVNLSLPYYFRESGGKKYAVVHPREFGGWSAAELDRTMAAVKAGAPDCLIIDLKDSVGGSFEEVLYLSKILGVAADFTFFYDFIMDDGIRRTGVSDYSSVTENVSFRNSWDGDLIVRTSSFTRSGGDFFSRWIQLNGRGIIAGEPTAGAGGGTSTFRLKNTGTMLMIPMRDRIIQGDRRSLEGSGVVPDISLSGSIDDLIKKLESAEAADLHVEG